MRIQEDNMKIQGHQLYSNSQYCIAFGELGKLGKEHKLGSSAGKNGITSLPSTSCVDIDKFFKVTQLQVCLFFICIINVIIITTELGYFNYSMMQYT